MCSLCRIPSIQLGWRTQWRSLLVVPSSVSHVSRSCQICAWIPTSYKRKHDWQALQNMPAWCLRSFNTQDTTCMCLPNTGWLSKTVLTHIRQQGLYSPLHHIRPVMWYLILCRGEAISPEKVSGMLLKRLVASAEAFLGEPIRGAVSHLLKPYIILTIEFKHWSLHAHSRHFATTE